MGSNDQLPLLAALHAYHNHSPMFLSIVSAQLKTFFVPKEDFTLKVTYLQGFSLFQNLNKPIMTADQNSGKCKCMVIIENWLNAVVEIDDWNFKNSCSGRMLR